MLKLVKILLLDMEQTNKKNIAEKVLNSQIFYRGNVYHKLLDYLIRMNFESKTPTEFSIAEDVFNKEGFNPADDTSVRVHIHNLRKKLNEYYHEEGKNDPIQLAVPKGHYELFFEKREEVETKTPELKQKVGYKIAFYITIALLTILIIKVIVFSSNPSNYIALDKKNPIWNHYFNNELTTSIVIGDFLEFHEYDTDLGRARRIQDYQINEADSLKAFIENYPKREIEQWIIGELPHNSLFNIIDIYPVFHTFNKKFDIAFTSEIDIDYINNRNIIYLGEFKNLRILNNLISTLPLEIITLPWWDGQINILDENPQKLKTYHRWEKNRYVVDLGIIAKLPGQNGENYIICAGFGYNSQIKLVKLLSGEDGLQLIKEQFGNGFPEYFLSVFEISGFDRASTTAEIKYIKPLSADYYNNAISNN